MPLLGKIVVIKRNGGDGTEFPLTAACLFGRKLDCDIRIQLPQVSKEHCRIELNENKELILTNLSSVNPTRINGDVINQSERLKHGDLITIIDRSFRFEYPPPKTPKKKKLSIGQEKSTEENNSLLLGDKKKSELSFDTCLKDGSNLPQSVELLEKESSNKKDTMSPFGELYQMVKQDLATKSPWRSSLPKTPASRPQASQDVQRASTPVMTPTSKKRRSFKVQHEDETRTVDPPHQDTAEPEEISATVPFVVSSKPSVTKKTPDSQKKRLSKASEALSPASAVQKILFQAQPQSQKKSDLIAIQTPVQEVKMSPRTSPRSNAGKRFQAQDVLCEMKTATSASGKKGKTSANQQSDVQTKATLKRKRVSFGGQLSPELFDKRLPPDSPLRRGATPRRSLGLTQKPQSLLRRASTIGLLTQIKEKASVKTPSPKRAKAEAKTPSPFKTSLNATPTIASVEYQTPRTRGRFSVSRVISPSPIQDQEEESKADPSICATPKIPLKRKSLKSSAKKTPKSALKSALVVMHSRRSGASRANLKVLNSWADIVKFGQIKPQADVAKVKKTTKGRLVKKAVVPKAKTPTRRLRDSISTGHAASPATIVVGKAHLRTSQCVVAAPKVIPNITVFKKDIKMDEDFTGVPDIFKTPACSKSKNVFPLNNDWSEALSDETSVMKTPEESGEMMVSPLSVASTECGHYNNEAVTRLLQTQDGSLLGDEGLSEPSDEACTQESVSLEMPLSDQTEQSIPETIKTPNQKTAPSSGLTGIKRLMKTPKQKFEPIMDIRGKLLKTPKPHHKPPQEECLQGIKELMKTPKHRGVPVEDMIGVKQMMQTPKENNPILCAAGLQRLMKTPMPKSDQQEDLSGVKELLQTPIAQTVPEEKVFSLERSVETVEKEINGAGVQQPIQVPEVKRDGVEDDQTTDVQQLEDPEIIDTEVEKGLTGVQQLFKTPKHKGQAVEEHMGLKRLMQTPKEKVEVVEDLTGVKQLLKTPKQRSEPVTNQFVLQKLMKTPREKSVVVEEDFSGIKELFEEPENAGSVIASVTETEMKESESGSASTPVEGITENTVDENICLLENTETGISKESESSFDPSVPLLTEFPLLDQRFVSTVELINTCPSDAEEPRILEKTKETVEATPKQRSRTSVTRTQHSSQRTSIKKSNESIVVNEVLQLEPSVQEEIGSPLKSTRGRKGKTLQTVPQVSSVPYRKSSRGRTVKLGFDDVRDTTVDQVPVHTSVSETSDCLPEPSKARRGRKAAEVPTDVSSHVHAPDLKRGRRKLKAILETQSTEEHDISTTEKLSEEKDAPVNKISFKKESSAPVPAPRARRGRPQKTPCPILENKITNRVDFVAENSVTSAAKSVKGRMVKSTKKELSEELPLDDDCKMVEEAVQNKETKPQVVKSVRGRRAKQQKLMPTAEAEDQPAQDGSTSANVTDEPHQTVVKPSRGGRKTRQSSTKPSTEPEKISDAVVVPEDPPVLKTGRKRTIGTKGLDTEKEVRTTRGRRAVAEFPPPVAVASTRGRRAKAESAVPRLVPLDAVSESKQECSFSKQKTECVVEQAETQEKLRIGRRGKRILTDHPNCPAHGSIEVGVLKPAKSVKWSPEVIDSTDSNRTESSEDVKQPELKKSKRLGNFSVKKASDSSDQSCTQLAKTSRGRGAKKVENSTVDDSAKEALTKVKPLMRGKSTVSRVPVTEPSVKAYTPQKRKRNEVLETTADDGIQKEHLAKRRGRIINTQDSAELANKDENIEVSAEKDKAETKKQGRGGRGQKKTTPEVSSPQEAGSSAAVANTRKARSSNKVEVPKEALPVRRTRRK